MLKRRNAALRLAIGIGVGSAVFLITANLAGAQEVKPKMIAGHVYRIHAGFLEVQSDPKNIVMVKVNGATIYWNGKTDKKASAKELAVGDEVMIEATEKAGLATAEKVRFIRARD